jgi:twitching motility protein PilT
MSEHLRDPDLDRLVHELNRRAGGTRTAAAGSLDDLEDDGGLAMGGAAGAADLFASPPAEPSPAAAPSPAAGAGLRPVAVSAIDAAAGGGARPRAAAIQAGSGAGSFNRALAGAELGFDADAPPQAEVDPGSALGALLADVLRRGASDLLLIPSLPPVFRVDGRLKRGESGALSGDGIARLFLAQLGGRAQREVEERGSADFSLRLPGAPGTARGGRETDGESALGDGAAEGGRAGAAGRFRVNLHRQRGQLAASLRALPREIPSLASLNLPAGLAELVKPSRGLILVCGPTGSGKSSTLAALLGEINRTRTAHIITIEDPVEYEHRSNRSLIEHVEVGRDARTFSEALRAALRQDPDIILVGEMRDLDTVATAVTAAETGHLVLATLHSNDAVQAVHRIVDVFPPVQQMQIRQQLALSLHAVVAQQLVPRADGRGRLPAIELMLASFPVRSHIRNDQLQKLYNEITLGRRMGMTSFEESLAVLVREGKIDLEEARVRASHPEELDARLRG